MESRAGTMTKKVALIATLGALYYALLWLPAIPCIGIPQVKMDLGAAFAPILGILLGPNLGALTVLIGDIVKTLTPPKLTAVWTIPCPALSAFVAGHLIRRNALYPSILLLAILISAIFAPPFNPITKYYYVYLAAFGDKIAALIIAITIGIATRSRIYRAGLKKMLLYASIFVAIESDKALGCFAFALPVVHRGIFGINSIEVVRNLYLVNPFVYVFVYILEAMLAFAIVLPILRIVRSIPTLKAFLRVEDLQLWS